MTPKLKNILRETYKSVRLNWKPLIVAIVVPTILVILVLLVLPLVVSLVFRTGLLLVIFLLLYCLAVWLAMTWKKHDDRARAQVDQQQMAMQSLVHITMEIVSMLDEDKVLQNIAQRAADLVHAPFGALLLYDKALDGVRLVAQTPYRVNLLGQDFKRGEGVAGTVFDTGKPLIVNGYPNWEKRITTNIAPLDAMVGVPLTWKGTVIGTLSIGDELKNRSFHDSDIQLLQPFADLASIAINNAKMFSQVKGLTAELEQRARDKTAQLECAEEELLQKNKQLQRLLQRLTKVQESERARISHDMHDSTTQLILAAVYASQAVMNEIDSNPVRSKEHLQTVQMLLRQIEVEIREAIRNLRPIILDQEGVTAAIKQYVDRVAVHNNLKCTFLVRGKPVRLSEEYEVGIYRIIQEAMQNILNHADAKTVEVSIDFQYNNVVVQITDDGKGFVYSEGSAQVADHFGLAGMRERAESLDATVEVISEPGRGTSVVLDVPRTVIIQEKAG